MKEILDYAKQSQKRYLDELVDFLAIPSISTDSSHNNDVINCADFLKKHLIEVGFQQVDVISTKRHPIVYAEYIQDKHLPTVLIYGHYDVQPAEPYELWESDPFKAVIKNDYIYARGVADDKGQIFCHIKAVEAYIKNNVALPVNVKFVIEGEEEIGSLNLPEFIRENKERLKADIALISDSPMYAKGQPSLCFSLRGLLYVELFVKGPNKDLHSGQFGGLVQNPIHALAVILASFKDEHDNVVIEGFYDDVPQISERIKQSLSGVTNSDETLKKDLDVNTLVGDTTFSSNERKWLRPTLDCNGIYGGYTKEGAKTIIPSEASAKISMRLVGKQDPEDILAKVKAHISKHTLKGVTTRLELHSYAKPASMSIDSKAMHAAQKAFERSYQNTPYYVGEGGTIPVVADFKELLSIDTVMMGFNLPDDGIHSPNERFGLENFYKGIETSLYFLDELRNA
jgi:acetylornithine deacetylase/succinyl-diaminopimelate desuccinylase-like protein